MEATGSKDIVYTAQEIQEVIRTPEIIGGYPPLTQVICADMTIN